MIHSEEIQYTDGETNFHGFLAFDNKENNPRPCILIAHDWGGRGEDFCQKAVQLAKHGYIGFAIDMYGEAKTTELKIERRALYNSVVSDRKKLANRILAAFEAAKNHPKVIVTKIAAIGYCFGGLCVLDLARTGADVTGVVSFHGPLLAPENGACTKVSAKILVLHGYDDPLVPPQQIQAFAKEMTHRKVDWQIHMYGLTQHSFTNPKANDDEMGLHYNEKADKRSWQSTLDFLKEVLA
ncbi:dienelactone hydrolase family protein (plasmid) [Legionella adelaidensis]|uniref:Dienelactone hydrolase family protein n=1 Tax=Legionella adelaidensis TaxID=45056 RepID=A0A0W0R0F8_9GAMM|nr:dienelactone hydrolase family protein [Legionella adelaidensis]KTC64494.1 dienelactone hydrolase family protein [Legionella adelaidensis]VEH85862.1 dienelactone hydrolase family protein [Legionella adelaidensis]